MTCYARKTKQCVSSRKVGKKLCVATSSLLTVKNLSLLPFSVVIQSWEKYQTTINHSLYGAPCKTMTHEVRTIFRKVKKQPTATLEEEALKGSLKAFETTVAKYTTGNAPQCNWALPMFEKAYVQVHFKLASEHLNNSEKFWKKVLWSDQTKIKRFTVDLTCCVWKKSNVGLKSTTSAVKNGGGNSMLWGCFVYKGTEQLHHDEVLLNKSTLHSARTLKMGQGWVFYQ